MLLLTWDKIELQHCKREGGVHQGRVWGVLGWAGGLGVGVCIVNAVSAQFHCEAGESTEWASLFVLPQKSLMHYSPQPHNANVCLPTLILPPLPGAQSVPDWLFLIWFLTSPPVFYPSVLNWCLLIPFSLILCCVDCFYRLLLCMILHCIAFLSYVFIFYRVSFLLISLKIFYIP